MKNDFKENGFYVVKNFLEKDFINFIQEYFFVRIKAGHDDEGLDFQIVQAKAFYADPLIETILLSSADSLSELIGVKLLPTYTYTRLYFYGAELKKHIDRPSCEISATLALGIPKNQSINPIYFSRDKDGKDAVEILLEPGDLCLYRGCELWHWRPQFNQNWYLQAFLHYVDADGPFGKDHLYDCRPFLAMPFESRFESRENLQ
jgi:hypothetical protein